MSRRKKSLAVEEERRRGRERGSVWLVGGGGLLCGVYTVEYRVE